jgi:hypothetical protein
LATLACATEAMVGVVTLACATSAIVGLATLACATAAMVGVGTRAGVLMMGTTSTATASRSTDRLATRAGACMVSRTGTGVGFTATTAGLRAIGCGFADDSMAFDCSAARRAYARLAMMRPITLIAPTTTIMMRTS